MALYVKGGREQHSQCSCYLKACLKEPCKLIFLRIIAGLSEAPARMPALMRRLKNYWSHLFCFAAAGDRRAEYSLGVDAVVLKVTGTKWLQ